MHFDNSFEVDNHFYEGIDSDNPNEDFDNYYLFDEFQSENELSDSLSFSDVVSQCVLVTLHQIWYDLGPLLAFCFVHKITVKFILKYFDKGNSTDFLIHSISVVCGFMVLHKFFKENLIYIIILLLLSYFVTKTAVLLCKGYTGLVLSCVIFLYLITCELYIVSPQKWHQVRGSQMILSMKLISLSIDLDNNQIILPTFISFLGYTLHTGSVIFGPWISFQQYTSNLTQKEKKSDKEWLFKLFKNLILSQIFLTISTCWLQWIIPDDTNKWLLAYRDAQSFRFSHYFVCFFSECTLIASGIGKDITVVKPMNIELPRSLVEVVTSWNLPMHTWLRKYVFNQVKRFGYFFAILTTYAASSLLHGLNFQLSAVLLSLGFYSYIEFALRKKLANLFNSCILARRCRQSECPNHQNKYWNPYVFCANLFFGFLTIFHLAYLGLMFDSSDPEQAEKGYSMRHTLSKWSKLDYASHIVVLVAYVLYLLI